MWKLVQTHPCELEKFDQWLAHLAGQGISMVKAMDGINFWPGIRIYRDSSGMGRGREYR